MTEARKSWALLLCAASIACSAGGKPADPQTPTAVASVPAPPPASTPSTSEEPAPEPVVEEVPDDSQAQAKLPPEQAAPADASQPPVIGQACRAPGGSGIDPCGTRRRVAIELDASTVRLIRGAECKPEKLQAPSTHIHSPMACLHGDLLYAANACVACRLPTAGWSARARVTELTPAQALEVQKQLGLPTAKPLMSVDEWKRALSAARAP